MNSYLPSGVLDAFVAEFLRGSTPGVPGGPESEGRIELAPHRNSKFVYEHRYLGHRIVAKVYDDVQDGLAAYQVWHAIWTNGFGPESIHRIPEPLIYIPERRAFLMEPAAGTCLLPLVWRDPVACGVGMRNAAHWLARLHASPAPAGAPDNSTRILYRLARKLVRAASRYPEMESTMVALISELGRRGDAFSSGESPPVVQTHGRYHCGHVFVAPGVATVIDLDRAAPSDPAKDVAEFLCRFRIGARNEAVKRRLGADLDGTGIRIFFEEYQDACGLPLSGLLYYWSATLLGILVDTAHKQHLDPDIRNARLAYFESEFSQLPELIAGLGLPA